MDRGTRIQADGALIVEGWGPRGADLSGDGRRRGGARSWCIFKHLSVIPEAVSSYRNARGMGRNLGHLEYIILLCAQM